MYHRGLVPTQASVSLPLCTSYLMLILIRLTIERVPAPLLMLIMPLIFFPRLALNTFLPCLVSFIFIVPVAPGGTLAVPAAIVTSDLLRRLSVLVTDPLRSLLLTDIEAVFVQLTV